MKRMNSTRFISQEELAKDFTEIALNEKRCTTGGIPFLVQGGKAFVDGSDTHTIVFGATGSRKTRMFAMPLTEILGRAGESFVVTDPKGEIHQKTAAHMRSLGMRTECINLRDLRAGSAWNPLLLPYEYYHGDKRTKALQLLDSLVTAMTEEKLQSDAYWAYTAGDVITGLILLLFETALPEECHMKSLLRLWMEYISNREGFLEYVKSHYGETMVYQKLSGLDNASERTVGSIESIVAMGLNRLVIDEELTLFLSQPGISIEQLVEEQTAFYIIVPDENRFYHFLVSIFLEQMYEVLIQKAQLEKNRTLTRRVNFIVDEFANLPKMQNMDSMITAARSRNIRFFLFSQGIQQIKEKYEEAADVICGNCSNWIYLFSRERTLLEEISRLCGEVVYDNNIRLPLVSEFELQHLGKEEKEALVLAGRQLPCVVNLPDIDEYGFEEKAAECGRRTQENLSERESVESDSVLAAEWLNPPVCGIRQKKTGFGKNEISAIELRKLLFREQETDAERVEKFLQKTGRASETEKKVWLAAAYRGMIIETKEVPIKEITETILRHGLEQYGKAEDAARLDWYRVSNDLAMGMQLLEMDGSLLYADAAELVAAESLRPIKNPFQKICKPAGEQECCYELSMEIVWMKERSRISLGEVRTGDTFPGLCYAHGVLFEKAREKLAGTEFTNLNWQEKQIRLGAGAVELQYVKKKNRAVYAYVRLRKKSEDCRKNTAGKDE